VKESLALARFSVGTVVCERRSQGPNEVDLGEPGAGEASAATSAAAAACGGKALERTRPWWPEAMPGGARLRIRPRVGMSTESEREPFR